MSSFLDFEGIDPVTASRESGEALTRAKKALDVRGYKKFLFNASSVEEFDQRAAIGEVSTALTDTAEKYLGSPEQHAKLLASLRREFSNIWDNSNPVGIIACPGGCRCPDGSCDCGKCELSVFDNMKPIPKLPGEWGVAGPPKAAKVAAGCECKCPEGGKCSCGKKCGKSCDCKCTRTKGSSKTAQYEDEDEEPGVSEDQYHTSDHKRFIRDMRNAGLGDSLRHYHGRFFWTGPAVGVEDIQDAMSETKVPLQWDNLGRRYIVYPKASGPSTLPCCQREAAKHEAHTQYPNGFDPHCQACRENACSSCNGTGLEPGGYPGYEAHCRNCGGSGREPKPQTYTTPSKTAAYHCPSCGAVLVGPGLSCPECGAQTPAIERKTARYDEEDEPVRQPPTKFAVCPTCEGKGSHVNPSIDAHGLTAEDFDDDPDFYDEYMGGTYDIRCNECGGKRVVPGCTEEGCNQPAENKPRGWGDRRDRVSQEHYDKCYEHLDPDDAEELQDSADMYAEMEAERRMGA